jgi:ADP-heptose:LPS heptosyltransferase
VFIRLDHIGDFILWQAAARSLCENYSEQRRILFANQAFVPLALALGWWDEVHGVQVKRLEKDLRYRFGILSAVRRCGAELVLQPVYSRSFHESDALVRASAAPRRIGFDGDLCNLSAAQKAVSDRWYTQLIKTGPEHAAEIQRNAQFASQVTGKHVEAVVRLFPELSSDGPAPTLPSAYFVINPGASWEGKQWPSASFAAVARAMFDQFGWHAVLCGAGSEQPICNEVATRLDPRHVTNLCGKTSLSELAELIRRARMVIGNDTATSHLAPAVGTPSVSIVGGGHFGRFLPYPVTVIQPDFAQVVNHSMPCYQCNWRCVHPRQAGEPVACIAAVPVAAVVDACIRAAALAKPSVASGATT